MFAVGGFDGSINIKYMNINTGKENEIGLREFTGHKGGVSALQFMSTAYMVSASFDRNIILWDIITYRKIVNVYKGHKTAITGLDVNQLNGNSLCGETISSFSLTNNLLSYNSQSKKMEYYYNKLTFSNPNLM